MNNSEFPPTPKNCMTGVALIAAFFLFIFLSISCCLILYIELNGGFRIPF